MDVKEYVLKLLRGVESRTGKDILALSDENVIRTFGGCTRSVADIVTEIISVNDRFLVRLQGGEPQAFNYEGWMKAPPTMQTQAAVSEGLSHSIGKLIAYAEGASPEDLEIVQETPMGHQSKYEILLIAASHILYHDGQINYIQTLLGDTDFHWG